MLKKDLAEALGISGAMVSKLAARGMPTHTIGAAREWRSAHLIQTHTKQFKAKSPPRPESASQPEGAVAAGPATVAGETSSDGGDTGYWHSRARREAAEAELAELKLAELHGELVRADEWVAALARRAVAFREGLLQIPARLAAQLAAETDEPRIHALLAAELRQVMFQLTDNQ